jgi:hypothetical protein
MFLPVTILKVHTPLPENLPLSLDSRVTVEIEYASFGNVICIV